ncbi:hypothetical protein GGI07_000584 [Coemansia sp. Benny D115]|nr:hypothetical protein GGI07_000584 [Coemansia sp. Benny D115]
MFAQDVDALGAHIKELVHIARQTGLDANSTAELRKGLDALLQAVTSTNSSGSTSNIRGIELLLLLIADALGPSSSQPVIPEVFGCFINAASGLLRSTHNAVIDIPSQGVADPTALYGARILDMCLAALVSAYESIEQMVGRDDAGHVAVQLACLCTEELCKCLKWLSAPGNSNVLTSPAIWKSTLENTSPVALYLVKICECSAKLYPRCANASLRRQPQCAELLTMLYKTLNGLVDLISPVFLSKAHLGQDAGMKRSLLERYCQYVLASHKSMLGSPPQFKATWQALCGIVLEFGHPSFDSAAWCLKVYLQSCETVRFLALQSAGLLKRTAIKDMDDPKYSRRLKGPMAFIRFLVFQMPALMGKVPNRGMGGEGKWDRIWVGATGMLDTVFSQLTNPAVLATLTSDMASTVKQLVFAACAKLVAVLMSHSTGLIQQHLRATGSFVEKPTGGSASQIPMVKGMESTEANRILLQVVVENIGSLSADQQRMLLKPAEGVTIIRAYAMAIDKDPASLFPTSPASLEAKQDGKRETEYEALAASLARCAMGLGSADVFACWENAMLLTILQSGPGSFGCSVAVDAWIALARRALPQPVISSTATGIIEAVVTNEHLAIGSHQRSVVQSLLDGLLRALSESELAKLSKSLFGRCTMDAGLTATQFASMCALVPWQAVSSLDSNSVRLIDVCRKILAMDSTHTGKDIILGALSAVLPAICSIDQQLAKQSAELIYSALDSSLKEPQAESAQSIAESATITAGALVAEHFAHATRILCLFASHLQSPVLSLPQPAYLLACFVGSFADARIPAGLLEPQVPLLTRIFAHLFSAKSAWIVRHEACVRAICFATESACPDIAMSLVPESMHGLLMAFIQHTPSGDLESIDRTTLYRAVFDLEIPCAGSIWKTRQHSGARQFCASEADVKVLLEASRALCNDLNVLRGRVTGDSASRVRAELVQLTRGINRFLSDI